MADRDVHHYYDRPAADYDDWWLGRGIYASQPRPGWSEEVEQLTRLLAELRPARVLDAACGTGLLTRHLRGIVVGLDESREMVEVAQRRLPKAVVVRGDALDPPFADQSFDRVLACHFYGNLTREEGLRFMGEAGRVGRELVLIDAALRDEREAEEAYWRSLANGAENRSSGRRFTADELALEIGGSVLFEGRWFVAAAGER
jgi:ubiquinone/menaquinone biosynthesis C-methylase UbiE